MPTYICNAFYLVSFLVPMVHFDLDEQNQTSGNKDVDDNANNKSQASAAVAWLNCVL